MCPAPTTTYVGHSKLINLNWLPEVFPHPVRLRVTRIANYFLFDLEVDNIVLDKPKLSKFSSCPGDCSIHISPLYLSVQLLSVLAAEVHLARRIGPVYSVLSCGMLSKMRILYGWMFITGSTLTFFSKGLVSSGLDSAEQLSPFHTGQTETRT
ncbi:hypothetical protein XENOCAPTIV_008609 [Xenoophorus captivus]|uniref:Uncharacterized protein n=1 Tax=Xenoophorus captivus TaxID=1517983 RepID=A0ABV0QI40_9TELE